MTVTPRKASSFPRLVSTDDWGGRFTRAEVNLDAIGSNVAALRRHARSRELMCVVKSDAYGHGAPAVAATALAHGATWLGVYTVDEGVILRRSGITAPVMVFGAFSGPEAVSIVAHGLIPTVGSTETAAALQAANPKQHVRFHIKIDTGLSRSGVHPHETLGLLRALKQFPALQLHGAFTHFARADEPSHPETARQFSTFMSTVTQLRDAGFDIPMLHVANSGAMLQYPEMHLDMGRCGITTYGYAPSREMPDVLDLTPALSLVSRAVRVHSLPAGAGVGYGHEFRCKRETRLALAPIGYGDGLPRTLGHGNGRVLIRGHYAPIVGRISMDQITVDVTDVAGAAVGDEVVLIGSQGGLVHDADDLGDEAGTISYDILTGLMPRVPRVYVRAGEIIAKS